MATVNVVKAGNKKAGSIEIDPIVFEAAVKPHLFEAEVRRQMSTRQAGTHSTKNRSLVSGGGAKPFRQKGTGRARAGTTRAPQWTGGGAVFGPVPRSHAHSLPKKMRRAALCGALSHHLKQESLIVIDAIEIAEYKTKLVVELLSGLGIENERVLIVTDEPNAPLERSARNLPNVRVLPVKGLNVYDTLLAGKILFTKAAVAATEARLGNAKQEGAE